MTDYREILRLKSLGGSVIPDRWLMPHRNCDSAAPEYSEFLEDYLPRSPEVQDRCK